MPRKIAKSPPGYYSPGEAMKRLGITDRDLFHSVVRKYEKRERLKAMKPAGVKMFPTVQIDAIADELKLILLQAFSENELDPIVFRVATPGDAQGVVNILTSLGWPTTSAELRQTWYAKNPLIDHVVTQNGIIVGYWNMVPYVPEVLAAMMAGRKRGWDIRPSDILTYEPGQAYDVFVGLAEHKQTPKRARVGRSLILGIFGSGGTLQQWAQAGIRIRRMYATIDEDDGRKTAALLQFQQQEAQPGDLFPRYMLDLETSDSHFVKQYREALPS